MIITLLKKTVKYKKGNGNNDRLLCARFQTVLVMTFYSDDLYNGFHVEAVNELTGYRECKLFKTKSARKAYITKKCNQIKRIYGF